MASWLLERFRELEEKSKSWPDWVWDQPLTREDAEKLARGESLRRSPRAMATDDDVIDRAETFLADLAQRRNYPGALRDGVDIVGAMLLALRASRARVEELERDRERLDWFDKTTEDDTPLVRWSDGTWSYGICGHWRPGGYANARDAIDAAQAEEKG